MAAKMYSTTNWPAHFWGGLFFLTVVWTILLTLFFRPDNRKPVKHLVEPVYRVPNFAPTEELPAPMEVEYGQD